VDFSQGFNPHPLMVFALPLSVGMESVCELLDIRTTRSLNCEEEKAAINATLPEGLKVKEIYQATRKPSEVKYAEYAIALDYGSEEENGKANDILQTLFDSSVVVIKKTKSGEKETDITPMIRRVKSELIEGRIRMKIICYAGNDNYLNPTYALRGLDEKMGKECMDTRILRTRIFDEKGKEFR